jgi:hypothetical protein
MKRDTLTLFQRFAAKAQMGVGASVIRLSSYDSLDN